MEYEVTTLDEMRQRVAATGSWVGVDDAVFQIQPGGMLHCSVRGYRRIGDGIQIDLDGHCRNSPELRSLPYFRANLTEAMAEFAEASALRRLFPDVLKHVYANIEPAAAFAAMEERLERAVRRHIRQLPIDQVRTMGLLAASYVMVRRPEFSGSGAGTSATCTVVRRVGDHNGSFSESVFLREFYCDTADWRERPLEALADCATAQALRGAFPGKLGNVYSTNEPAVILHAMGCGANSPEEALAMLEH